MIKKHCVPYRTISPKHTPQVNVLQHVYKYTHDVSSECFMGDDMAADCTSATLLLT